MRFALELTTLHAHYCELVKNTVDIFVECGTQLAPLLAYMGDGLVNLTVTDVGGFETSWINGLAHEVRPISELTVYLWSLHVSKFPIEDVL